MAVEVYKGRGEMTSVISFGGFGYVESDGPVVIRIDGATITCEPKVHGVRVDQVGAEAYVHLTLRLIDAKPARDGEGGADD